MKKKTTTPTKVNILGSIYTIKVRNFSDDPLLYEDGSEGYCIPEAKEIVICDMSTYPGYPNSRVPDDLTFKETLRHEILHAFLFESGLYTCSSPHTQWAMNEEMVDWLALQSPKIFKAYQEVNAL